MKTKPIIKENPQIEVSFAKENRNLDKQQLRLNMEILRVHTIQKHRATSSIWSINQNQLCQYFTHYDFFPQIDVSIEQLLNSTHLKLIKSDGKIYFGEIVRKKKEGKGISITREGRIFEGSFNNNQKNGEGVEIYPNGNLYIGQFQNGKKHGTGKFYWFNMSSKNPKADQFVQYYEGEWWGGLPDGQGVHQKLGGDLYMGIFKNGLKHGEGTEWFGNGDFYKGEFVNGMPQGYGQYIWEDGSSFVGDFKQGLRNGYGVWKANNNRLQSYKGHYAMDKKSGYGVYTWDSGWCYKGNFQNDYRNGYGELYDGETKLNYRGFWENGQQTEKEVVMSKGERQLNFRSVQFSRYDTLSRKYSNNDKHEGFDAKNRSITKQRDAKMDMPPDYATLSHLMDSETRKRPQSFNGSHKAKRAYPAGSSNKSIKAESGKNMPTMTSRMMVGSIKSNLFVPYKHAGW